MSDILPTIASAADVDIEHVDGLNQWDEIVNGERLRRNQVVNVINNVEGLIDGTWKIVNGTGKLSSNGYSEKEIDYKIIEENYHRSVLKSKVHKSLNKLNKRKILDTRQKLRISCHERKNPMNNCEPDRSPCLFNIHIDPCERHNLAEKFPEIMTQMIEKLLKIRHDE